MQKYYLSTSLCRKNWNSNCLKLSVNNVQSRATIVALVPWRNFFLYAHNLWVTRVKKIKKKSLKLPKIPFKILFNFKWYWSPMYHKNWGGFDKERMCGKDSGEKSESVNRASAIKSEPQYRCCGKYPDRVPFQEQFQNPNLVIWYFRTKMEMPYIFRSRKTHIRIF